MRYVQYMKKIFIGIIVSSVFITGNGDSKQSIVYAKEVEETTEDYTVWTQDYLFEYISDDDLPLKKYKEIATKLLEKKIEENVYNVNLNGGLFEDGSFTITSQTTDYRYTGKIKNNKPSGFGVLERYYKIKDGETYIPVYIGEFSKGKFDGEGIQYCDRSDSMLLGK